MKAIARVFMILGLSAAFVLPARAQEARYQLRHALSFDLWCAEEERLPYERCEKKLPEDVKRFEHYRDIIEHYEIPAIKERDRALRLDEDLLGLGEDDGKTPAPPK
jgi:hypothetical protein